MPVQPLNITGPNVAGAVHTANTENMAREQLADTTRRTDILDEQVKSKARSDLVNQLNVASQIQERNLKNAVSRTKVALSLLSGVNDQESFDSAKTTYMRLIPVNEKAAAEQAINSMFGVRYSARRVKQAREQLLAMSGQLQSILTPKTVGEGAKLVDPTTGKVIAEGGDKTYKPDTPVAFENDKGNQIWVKPGNPIPTGYKKVMGKGTSVTTNVTIPDPLTKATKTKVQGEIIEGLRNMQSFQSTGKLFKSDYLTYLGKGEKAIAQVMDKAGVSTKGQQQYITEYNTWFRQAKSDFIAYRKWATGVAGGPAELKEIATSFPDPVNNSPTQYAANLKSIEATTKKVLLLNRDFLQSGIDVNQSLADIAKQMADRGLQPPPGYGNAKPQPDTLTPEQEAAAFLSKHGIRYK